MKTNFISDDFIEAGYVQESPGLHLATRFTYRPALIEERVRLYQGFQTLSSEDCERKSADFLAKKIKTWDIIDGKGAVVPITTVNILKLRPSLIGRLQQIVLGSHASDTDPQWSDEKRIASSEEKFESALSGLAIGEHREAESSKN